MMPPDPKDDAANEWFNKFIPKLRYKQDYFVYPGSSKKMFNAKGEQTGISIVREDVRLYSTGITKLYEMIVEGKELPDVEYTPEQEKQFYEDLIAKYPELAEEE
jgi:choline kinase